MQHSPFEIKEKLLRALDEDNNVVDMAAVIEVISILERTPITKDVLEKTRLGRYVNELRKKTSNEQLARRAKDLIKNWKKLLSQVETVVNGERDGGPTCTPPIGVTSGPGPGDPSAATRSSNRNPALGRFKPASPAVRPEQITSPHCSSSSNSPLSLLSCSRSLPGHSAGTYAPPPKGVGAFSGIGEKTSHTSNGNVGASHSVNQVFKPVSPALAAVHHNTAVRPATPGSSSQPLARPKPHSPIVGNSSKQRSPCLSVPGKLHPGKRDKQSAFSEFSPSSQSSPATARGSSSSAHSNLEVSKTNVANKRLRKDVTQGGVAIPKKKMCVPPGSKPSSPRVAVMNGVEVSPSKEKLLGGTSCELAGGDAKPRKNVKYCASSSSVEEKSNIKGLSSNPVSDKCQNKHPKGKADPADVLKEKLSAVYASGGGGSSSPRLPKVKTTEQLIADLQAKCSRSGPMVTLPFGDIPKPSGNYSLLGGDAETSKTKSELMDRFLQSSSSHSSPHPSKSDKESRELHAPCKSRSAGDQNVPNVPDEKTSLSGGVDPVSREINEILSKLPPLNASEIRWEEDEAVPPPPPPPSKEVTRDDVNRLSTEHWEMVNGNTDHENNWREWHETTTLLSHDGCLLHILPYVNIDW